MKIFVVGLTFHLTKNNTTMWECQERVTKRRKNTGSQKAPADHRTATKKSKQKPPAKN